ncbi:antA/AntB antirepressor family protein [Bartonella sp. WD16.2]|uniref:antA/AntB antirepressor family protein n=1 Tax=Bartonella sp. WD16.2 TaxID=1933904 RepID=UPI0009C3C9C8|nr:antA/AntB antirepressor family protein [Bartonella sp. WD16.2]AQX19756.1 Phage anti-repressor protein [Bartonella sp. WD16.2]
MNKQVSVGYNEVLLIITGDEISHPALYGPFSTAEIMYIVNTLNNVIKIFCINPDESSLDDLSEEIAEIYVKNSDSSLLERETHLFIEDSEVYYNLLRANRKPPKWMNAYALHERLKVKTNFNDWITQRIQEYKLKKEDDFYIKNDDPPKGYYLTIDIAKKLAKAENSDAGKEVYRYLCVISKVYKQ